MRTRRSSLCRTFGNWCTSTARCTGPGNTSGCSLPTDMPTRLIRLSLIRTNVFFETFFRAVRVEGGEFGEIVWFWWWMSKLYVWARSGCLVSVEYWWCFRRDHAGLLCIPSWTEFFLVIFWFFSLNQSTRIRATTFLCSLFIVFIGYYYYWSYIIITLSCLWCGWISVGGLGYYWFGIQSQYQLIMRFPWNCCWCISFKRYFSYSIFIYLWWTTFDVDYCLFMHIFYYTRESFVILWIFYWCYIANSPIR
jgi:hypothetical protein